MAIQEMGSVQVHTISRLKRDGPKRQLLLLKQEDQARARMHHLLLNPSQSISADDVTGSLKHPPWIPLITRIPKAAKSACTSALSKVLKCIITDQTQLEAWDSLFSFAPTVLAKPTRGGSCKRRFEEPDWLRRCSVFQNHTITSAISPVSEET